MNFCKFGQLYPCHMCLTIHLWLCDFWQVPHVEDCQHRPNVFSTNDWNSVCILRRWPFSLLGGCASSARHPFHPVFTAKKTPNTLFCASSTCTIFHNFNAPTSFWVDDERCTVKGAIRKSHFRLARAVKRGCFLYRELELVLQLQNYWLVTTNTFVEFTHFAVLK